MENDLVNTPPAQRKPFHPKVIHWMGSSVGKLGEQTNWNDFEAVLRLVSALVANYDVMISHGSINGQDVLVVYVDELGHKFRTR
jgi:hypothetical protein